MHDASSAHPHWPAWSFPRLRHLELGDRLDELTDVFKAPVYRCKAHISNLIKLTQFFHDQIANKAGSHFFLPAMPQSVTNAFDGALHTICTYRTLAQGQLEAALQFCKIKLNASAVTLDHGGHEKLCPLVGSEAALASRAATAPPDDVTLFLHTCVDHLGVGSIAVGAFHGRAVAVVGLTVNGETSRQFVHLRTYGSQVGFILGIVEHVGQQVGCQLSFRFLEA